MSHTPGPWHACKDGDCSCKTVMSNDYPICKVTAGNWGDDYPSVRLVGDSLDRKAEAYMEQITYGEVDEETAKANARLIAAAPELLDVAKHCEAMVSTASGPPNWDWIREVIAKATKP